MASETTNKPLITAIVMLVGVLTGVPVLIAVIMAYIFKGEVPQGSWEHTHYSYHIRTFWVSILLLVVGLVLIIIGIGFLILAALPIWVLVRSVIPLVKSINREPMPNPYTWLV